MLSREGLVEFPYVLDRETLGAGENRVTLAVILDQPDHASGFSNLIGRWCSWCEIPAGSVSDCLVCLCVPGYGYRIWIPIRRKNRPPKKSTLLPSLKFLKTRSSLFLSPLYTSLATFVESITIALELAASVLLLNSFCPYTWPFEQHCPLLRLLEEN
jgi:hypothetical protein